MKRHVFVIAVSALFIISCEEITGKLKIVEGNFYFSRGMVNDAIGSYLDALKYSKTESYANFALGTTYLSLEQTDAALERFNKAEAALHTSGGQLSLLFSIRYNRAVANFERGDFENAAAEFRGALEADNSSMEAKRNLELSLISMEREYKSAAIERTGIGSVGYGKSERDDIIFDYIRQKESGKWKSWEWSGEDSVAGPDY